MKLLISGFGWCCCCCQRFLDSALMYLAGQMKERCRSELGSKWGKAGTCAFGDYSELIIAFFLFL